jgi:hypothetical protein
MTAYRPRELGEAARAALTQTPAGLRAFLDHTRRCRVAILAHAGSAAVQLGDWLHAIPLATVLS